MKKVKILQIITVILIFILALILVYLYTNKKQITLITYKNSIKSNSYSEKSCEGLKELKLIAKVNCDENTKKSEFTKKVNENISNGTDLLISIDNASKTSIYKLAQNNKKVNFVVFNTEYNKNLDNLTTVEINYVESGFLAGVLAAKETKTKKIAFLGGINNDIANQYEDGFKLGVKMTNTNIKVTSLYIGNNDDESLAYENATNLYNLNNDIIFQILDDGAIGVMDSAKENNKYFIGLSNDQEKLFSNNILASININMNTAVKNISKSYLKKEKIGGKNFEYGISDGVIKITLKKNVNSNTKQIVKELETKFKNKDINISNNKVIKTS